MLRKPGLAARLYSQPKIHQKTCLASFFEAYFGAVMAIAARDSIEMTLKTGILHGEPTLDENGPSGNLPQ